MLLLGSRSSALSLRWRRGVVPGWGGQVARRAAPGPEWAASRLAGRFLHSYCVPIQVRPTRVCRGLHPVLVPVGFIPSCPVGWAEAAEAFIPSGFIPSGGPMPRPPSRSRGAEAAEVFTMCFTGGPRRPVGTHAGLHPDLGGPVRHMWQHIPPRQAQRGSRSPGSGLGTITWLCWPTQAKAR